MMIAHRFPMVVGSSRARPGSKQRGMSLPMVAIIVGTMAVVALGVARRSMVVSSQAAGSTMGYALNQVSLAVDNYRGSNLNALTNATPAVTGFADPMAPTTAELQAAGYLNGAVATTLPDGNTYRIQLAKMPAGCTGPAAGCNVWSMVSLTKPLLDLDNSTPSTTRLSALVAAVSEPVGFSALPTPAQITGGNGAWTVANPDATGRAGIVVVVAGLGGTGTQWLRVGDPRDPAFTGNTSTAGYVKPSTGTSQTVVAGNSCGTDPSGAIRNDSSGRVLSCQSGIWVAGDGAKAVITQTPLNNIPGGQAIAYTACPSGGTPWATYAAQTAVVNDAATPPYEVVVYSVSQSGSNWITKTEAVRPPSTSVTVNSDSSILGVIPVGVFTAGCRYS